MREGTRCLLMGNPNGVHIKKYGQKRGPYLRWGGGGVLALMIYRIFKEEYYGVIMVLDNLIII